MAVLVLAPFSKAFSTGIWLRTISKKASSTKESVGKGVESVKKNLKERDL